MLLAKEMAHSARCPASLRRRPSENRGALLWSLRHRFACASRHISELSSRSPRPRVFGRSGRSRARCEQSGPRGRGDRLTRIGRNLGGQCPYCRSGNFLFCPTRRGMGHGVRGEFTRYGVMREDLSNWKQAFDACASKRGIKVLLAPDGKI
jgi:hypothetical protein